jgi:hypothetical protein
MEPNMDPFLGQDSERPKEGGEYLVEQGLALEGLGMGRKLRCTERWRGCFEEPNDTFSSEGG